MRIVFLGRRPHASTCLKWLVNQGHEVKAVVAPSGVGTETPYWAPTLKDTAQRLGLNVYQVDEFASITSSTPEFFGQIDLVVSFLFWKRISPEVAGLARYGCINFHPAPLPDYKGLAGYNFAILDKLQEWGVTAHYVDSGFDSGPIISVRHFPFDWRSSTALSLEEQTREPMVELFQKTIEEVNAKGHLPTIKNEGGRYITRSEMEAAKKLDLNRMSSEEIAHRARAFWYPPFDGAYFEKDGLKFTVTDRTILEDLTALHNVERPLRQTV